MKRLFSLVLLSINTLAFSQAPFDGFLFFQQRSYSTTNPAYQPPGSNQFPSLPIPCTIEFFYNPVDTMYTGPVFCGSDNVVYYDLGLQNTCTGTAQLQYYNGSTTYAGMDVTKEFINAWHHVVIEVKLDGSDIVYTVGLDGEMIYSTITSGTTPPIFNVSWLVEFGRSSFFSSTSTHNKMYVDEFRASNILRYNLNSLSVHSPYTVPTTEFVSDGNTTVLWHFNEADNDTAFYDATGGNVNMTGMDGCKIVRTEYPFPASPGMTVNVVWDSAGAYIPAENAWVYCIQVNVDSSSINSVVIDSALTDAYGNAFIDNYAYPFTFWANPDTNLCPGTIPTYEDYFYHTELMLAAYINENLTCSYNNHGIALRNGVPFPGFGSFGGVFIYAGRANGDPVPGLNLILKNGGQLVAFTETDANGYFKFDHLADGTYEIVVDQWDLFNNNEFFTLSSTDPNSDSLLFTLYPDDVVLEGYVGVEDQILETIHLFPNPVTDFVNTGVVNIPENSSYEITTISGSVVAKSIMNSSTIQLPEGLTNGIYFLTLRMGNNSKTYKFIK